MSKKTNQYLKNYFNHNGIVLLCELLIVLLLSMICTILIDGSPRWLAPTLAVAAYLLAEIRFMMAYVAKCVKRDHAMEAETTATEAEEEKEMEEEDDESELEEEPIIPEEDEPELEEPADEDDVDSDLFDDDLEDLATDEDDEDINTFGRDGR